MCYSSTFSKEHYATFHVLVVLRDGVWALDIRRSRLFTSYKSWVSMLIYLILFTIHLDLLRIPLQISGGTFDFTRVLTLRRKECGLDHPQWAPDPAGLLEIL